MLLIQNDSHTPPFNIALDHYMLTGFTQEVVRLWRNDKSVIIGRNQNAPEEMDLDFIRENDVTVVRRLSGGGAVFQDLGNICFTFVTPYVQGDFNNYDKFTAPIRDYLQTLGVKAELSGRNDLTVDGMKISGNAQTVKNGRIMHHGTLLFSLNMSDLVGALRPKDIKIQSKGIKSVRSRVTNISSHLKTPMTVEEFLAGLENYLLQNMEGLKPYTLTAEDENNLQGLIEQRYANWDWNFGHSPACDIRHSSRYECGVVETALRLEGGRLAELSIYGDFFGIRDKEELEKALIGKPYDRAPLLEALQNLDGGLEQYISGLSAEQLCDLLLGSTNK